MLAGVAHVIAVEMQITFIYTALRYGNLFFAALGGAMLAPLIAYYVAMWLRARKAPTTAG